MSTKKLVKGKKFITRSKGKGNTTVWHKYIQTCTYVYIHTSRHACLYNYRCIPSTCTQRCKNQSIGYASRISTFLGLLYGKNTQSWIEFWNSILKKKNCTNKSR